MNSYGTYSSDPLAHLVCDKLRLGRIRFGILYLLLYSASYLPVFVTFKLAWQGEELAYQQEFLLSPMNLVFTLVVVPLIGGFYLWISTATGEVLRNVRDSDIFEGAERYDSSFKVLLNRKVQQATSLTNHPAWIIAAFAASGLVVVAMVLQEKYLEGVGAPGDHAWVGALISAPVVWMGIYMVAIIIAKELSIIVGFWQIFRAAGTRIRLHPWHADKCGGLGPINRYAVNFAYLMAITAFGLSLVAYRSFEAKALSHDYVAIAAIVIYIALAPSCFFGTLGAPHGNMKKAKDQYLTLISKRLLKEYQDITDEISVNLLIKLGHKDTTVGSPEVKARLERIEELQKLYRMTQTFPIWPWDTASLRRFVTATVGGVSPTLLSVGFSLFDFAPRLLS